MFLYYFEALLKKIELLEALDVGIIQIFPSDYLPVALGLLASFLNIQNLRLQPRPY